MKKILASLCACLLIASSALAEVDLSDYAIANGVVSAAEYVDVTAPYSGTLLPFALEAGDTVSAGETLLQMMTTTLYATEEGSVEFIHAQPGDDASALIARYGSLLTVNPAQQLRINASTNGSYMATDNKYLHVGETVYFRSSRTGYERGSGRLVLVEGENYVVDILDGDFFITEQLTLYRDDDYSQKECVGKGVVVRRTPLYAVGQGRVADILVEVGDTVKSGTPLLTLMGPDADPSASPFITSPANAVVAAIQAAPGQQVWKGQVLARLYLTDKLEVIAEVDEIELNGLRVGDPVYVTLDIDEETIITGTVTEISSLGAVRQNAAYFTVHVSIQAPFALLGGSASVYLPGR